MGYYKELEKVYLDGTNYCGLSTPSEMKKRGVSKDSCVELSNKITSIELINYFEKSGSVEYGLGVELKCTFETGETINVFEDGMNYLSILKSHTVVNGVMSGDFILLFKGVVVNLTNRNSSDHKKFIKLLKEEKDKNNKSKDLKVEYGDIVDIHGNCVYLGEHWLYKPNLKNDDGVNKLRKYKLYIELDSEGNYMDGDLHIESGKTKYNQPTKILGNVKVNLDELKSYAFIRMRSIFKEGVGYSVNRNGYYGTSVRAFEKTNRKTYILSEIVSNKEEALIPNYDDLLKLGWLCGWDIDDKLLEYKKDSSGRSIIPYEYKLKQK